MCLINFVFQQLTDQIMVKVLFFAKAKEIVQTSESNLTLASNLTVDQIYQALEKKWPKLKILKRTFALALNEEYLEQDSTVTLNQNDILAVIPPISGG